MKVSIPNPAVLALVVLVVIAAIFALSAGKTQPASNAALATNSSVPNPAGTTTNLARGGQVGLLAPGFVVNGEWFNLPNPAAGLTKTDAQGLSIDELKGKVVLVDFWTYSCINCQRTIPYLKAWNDQYAKDGLVIVGVHTPEFDFEKDPDNVRMALAKYGVTWPVFMDNAQGTWDAYANRYWPHKYLIDANGVVRYDHIGEGGYEETEKEIVSLLSEAKQAKIEMKNATQAADQTAEQAPQRQVTPETYLGFARANAFGNAETPTLNASKKYTDDGTRYVNAWYLDGPWTIEQESLVSGADLAHVRLVYVADKAKLVLSSDHAPTNVTVLQDGAYVTRQNAGVDVQFDAQNHSYVTIDAARLYALTANGGYDATHELTIQTDTAGVRAYAFTFG